MKYLSQALPRVRQLVWSSHWFAPCLLVTVGFIELFGRFTPSDIYDVAGICFLMALAILVLERHRVKPMAWVNSLERFFDRMFAATGALKFEMGIDFRGDPPIPRRIPPMFLAASFGFVLLAAAGMGAWLAFPNGWRQPFSQVFYIGYLATLITVWGVLFLFIMVGGFFLPVMLYDRFRPPRPRGTPLVTGKLAFYVTLYAGFVSLMYYLLPFWVVPALCGAALLVVAVGTLMPNASATQFIWRSGPEGKVRSITSRRLVFGMAAAIVLALVALTAISAGNLVLGRPKSEGMEVTNTLGTLFGWLVPSMLISGTALLVLMWRDNPSRPSRPRVHVSDCPASSRLTVRSLLGKDGWNVAFAPSAYRATDVKVRIVPQAESEANEYDAGWPLAMGVKDFSDANVRDRLVRRDEIIKRRLFLKGLEKLFRAAKKRSHPGGSGYWLAPHQWLMRGMLRDDMDESDGDESSFLTRPVGPPYCELLDRSVRHYLYVTLRALQVDLIFVEDGVGHRKLAKVMRKLFEIYDKSAGKRRAEDLHFAGMPKVKVMFHEFLMDNPFESNSYPEPRFENLGRARILHVFRDRGDADEFVEPPFDFEWSQGPLMLV